MLKNDFTASNGFPAKLNSCLHTLMASCKLTHKSINVAWKLMNLVTSIHYITILSVTSSITIVLLHETLKKVICKSTMVIYRESSGNLE